MIRIALHIARLSILPFLVLGIVLLMPFAVALDWVETKLYGGPRTAKVNRG